MGSSETILEARGIKCSFCSVTLDTALKLWLSKEKTKYIDKKIELRAAYYAEWNKR